MRTLISRHASLYSSAAFAKAKESGESAGDVAEMEKPAEGEAGSESTGEATGEQTEGNGESNANGLVVPLLDKTKVQAIKKALGGDRVYCTGDESGSAFSKAEAIVAKAAGETDSFYGLPILTRSSEEQPIENAKTIVIMTLGVRKDGTNGYKAIVITEQPDVDAFLASDEARDFVTKLIQREACDVAFSAGIRTAETMLQLENAVSQMPITVESIVQTQRESGGGLDTDAFDAMWQVFRSTVIKVKNPKLNELLPQKPIVIKAMRSKAYAESDPKTQAIEKAGMFARLLEMLIAVAPKFTDSKGKPTPQDPSAMQDWLDNRESLVLAYTPETIQKVDDLSAIQF